ncbi:MAG: FAD-dependent oxidoreductase [Candidatus Omnitrophota bacterium]
MSNREIKCDVLVVGAGVSGVAAAMAAFRKGARTLLLEQNDFAGGTVVLGMHRYLCGLYSHPGSATINSGIARELVSDLRRMDRRNRKISLGRVGVFAFRREDLRDWIHARIKRRKNFQALFNCRVYALTRARGAIREVLAQSGNRKIKIFPRAVVDASGEGVVIRLSRAWYCLAASSRRQLAGFSFRVKGVDDPSGMLPIKVPYHLKFATYADWYRPGEGIIRLNIPAGRSPKQFKARARKAFGCLKEKLPEFKAAVISEFSPLPVEREGIRLRGEYTLTAGDVLRGRKFSDGVVKSAWPIELWDRKAGPRYQYLRPGQYYEIPLRCLRSKNIGNLLAAGRCISADPQALGSTRVAGTCLSLGEQAGIAAAELSFSVPA